MRFIVLVGLLVVPGVVSGQSGPPFWRTVMMGTHGMVAAEHPLEARAALAALEAGGNAFDAALAAFYMTTVVEQHQAGIGGDGLLLAYSAKDRKVVFFNGTGPAPRKATREFYRELGGIPDAGPHSSLVPGAVAGFELAWQRYGSLERAKLLAPAIEAAAEGHPLSFWSASYYKSGQPKFAPFPSSTRVLLNSGRPFEPGEVHKQPDLAKTLRAIAAGGRDAFYKGEIAKLTAKFYEQQQGLLAYDDLAGFEAEQSEPIRTTYKGYEIHQSAPNSHGIVLLIALNMLEGDDPRALGHNSPDYLHLLTEVFKLAFADRNQYIGDPRFVKDMPVEGLLSKEYARARRGLVKMDRAIAGEAPPGDPRNGKAVLAGHQVKYAEAGGGGVSAGPGPADGGETSSFSVADRFGNLVSVTHSVNATFGSGMIVEGTGMVLNDRMPYFSLEEGDVNVLEPGKRPRHTINPALALKDGKPFLAWNTPGGDNQPQAMLQAFLNVVEFGWNVQQAVEAATATSTSFGASMYPQKAAGELEIPKVLADRVGQALAARGHRIRVNELQQPYRQQPSGAGAVKMVLIDPVTGVMHGGVSPAKDNYAMGW